MGGFSCACAPPYHGLVCEHGGLSTENKFKSRGQELPVHRFTAPGLPISSFIFKVWGRGVMCSTCLFQKFPSVPLAARQPVTSCARFLDARSPVPAPQGSSCRVMDEAVCPTVRFPTRGVTKLPYSAGLHALCVHSEVSVWKAPRRHPTSVSSWTLSLAGESSSANHNRASIKQTKFNGFIFPKPR